MELSEYEIGWLSAAIDGEGSVIIQPHKHKNSLSIDTIIQIINTNIMFVEYAKKITNIGYIIQHTKGYPESKRRNVVPTYTWKVTKQADIINLLTIIGPSLIIKKKRAELTLKFLHSRKKERQSFGKLRKRRHFNEEEILIMEEVRKLNKRRVRIKPEEVK